MKNHALISLNWENEIVTNIPGFQYPRKVVIAVEGGITTVITGHPLKKGRKKGKY